MEQKFYPLFSKAYKTLFFIGLCVGIDPKAQAQFHITESFKSTSTSNQTILGRGDENTIAYLTAGNGDDDGSGWLRLTKDDTYKIGYMHVNTSFPSVQSAIVEFEYKSLGAAISTRSHAGDGISVFLLDGEYGPTGSKVFKSGGYGGSLGYVSLSYDPVGPRGGYYGNT
ncbi:MAG: hypothetical protein QM610_15035 [Chitinophagaceae bacterium]